MTSRLCCLVAACVLSMASRADADVELKNDGFVSGGQANFQTGFVGGEAGAVRFVSATAGRQLLKLHSCIAESDPVSSKSPLLVISRRFGKARR